ncbi:MAG: DUF1659 domain-containing protein [Candidatus Saccharibacteria bacterium]
MAVTSTPIGDTLNIVLDNGVSATGQQLTKTVKYPDVRAAATDNAVKDVADAIASAMSLAVMSVIRNKNAELDGTPE